MPRLAVFRFFLLISFTLLLGCNASQTNTNPHITVACAANLKLAIDSIAKQFEGETGTQVTLAYNASGMLFNQIDQGAPFDVFLSAAPNYPQKLNELGLSIRPQVFAVAQLVLVTNQATADTSPADFLLRSEHKRIALAQPKTAPFGQAAMQYLTHLGIQKQLDSKLVYAQNVGGVDQFLESQSVDAGFTSQVVLTRQTAKQKHWILPSITHDPLKQTAVVLSSSPAPEPANTFLEYLRSRQAQAVLTHFGYLVP